MNDSLPVLFVSHGSPMHAVMPSDAAISWAKIATEIPRPDAILMVSAHWNTGLPLVSGAEKPETIHDFGGFPDELYRIRYPAPGNPALAQDISSLIRHGGMTAGVDGSRGLDHGAWVPLLKMYPDADIPVLQLSVQPELGAAHHYQLGLAIQTLRQQGVLVVASGHMTHNLRDWFGMQGQTGIAPYAKAFRDWVAERLESGAVDELLQWEDLAPGARRAHPSVEHFLPLFVGLGAAGPAAKGTSFFTGYDSGVLAMDAYRFD
jgi:4,5-DOPA dioxygenase extradiol